MTASERHRFFARPQHIILPLINAVHFGTDTEEDNPDDQAHRARNHREAIHDQCRQDSDQADFNEGQQHIGHPVIFQGLAPVLRIHDAQQGNADCHHSRRPPENEDASFEPVLMVQFPADKIQIPGAEEHTDDGQDEDRDDILYDDGDPDCGNAEGNEEIGRRTAHMADHLFIHIVLDMEHFDHALYRHTAQHGDRKHRNTQ